MRRRVPPAQGVAALKAWRSDRQVPRAVLATAVRFLLEELGERVPGRTLEVRVPPFGAVQCLPGPRHTRGTPPNVVEMDAATWLALAGGELGWDRAVASGAIRASGSRADLRDHLPLRDPTSGA